MADVDVSLPTSRRGYLSQDELAQFANITINDSDEADDKISQAEELIDAYVGYQDKFLKYSIQGVATGGSSTSLTLQSKHQNTYDQDYFVGMQLEIIGGTAKGEIERITASTKAGVLTTDTFDTSPASGSTYKISQIGKFPRRNDVFFETESGTNRYYRSIPEAVRRAVAAQVEFEIEMGEAFLKGNNYQYNSERIGDYAYTKEGGGGGIDSLIAPKAKQLLRGIKNRKGAIIT